MNQEAKKKTRFRVAKGLLVLIALALPAVWMTQSILSTPQVACEVCQTYKGKTSCRRAEAEKPDHCLRTAIDNACGILASGVTEVLQCTQKAPSSSRLF